MSADVVVDQDPIKDGCQSDLVGTGSDGTETDFTTTGPDEPTESTTNVVTDTTETNGETETDSTTGPPPGCTGTEGQYDPECPNNLPFCVGGTCTGCDEPDAGVCTMEAGGEVCDSSGACVQCNETNDDACGGTSPICGDDNLCTACTAHDQCPGGAGCHIFEGSCLPENMVLMVDAGGSISNAIDTIGAGAQGTIHIAGASYTDNFIIPGGSVIALIGNNDVVLTASNGARTVEVLQNSTAYLAGITVQNSSATPAPGIESDGDLRLDRSTVRLSIGDGVISNGGQVHLENTRIFNNSGVGLEVGGTDSVTLRNVILANNGSGSSPRGFVTAGNTPYTIVYSTIADNAGTTGGAINSPNGMGEVRNSILVSNSLTDSVTIGMGATLTIENSVVADDDYSGANGNIPVRILSDLGFDGTWGVATDSIAQDVAVWQMGDPLIDIDGDPRPGMMGKMDYAGADVPK